MTELRDRLIAAALGTDQYGQRVKRAQAPRIVDAILAEIKEAGFELQPVDRMMRLREAARRWDMETSGWNDLMEGDMDEPA